MDVCVPSAPPGSPGEGLDLLWGPQARRSTCVSSPGWHGSSLTRFRLGLWAGAVFSGPSSPPSSGGQAATCQLRSGAITCRMFPGTRSRGQPFLPALQRGN